MKKKIKNAKHKKEKKKHLPSERKKRIHSKV